MGYTNRVFTLRVYMQDDAILLQGISKHDLRRRVSHPPSNTVSGHPSHLLTGIWDTSAKR